MSKVNLCCDHIEDKSLFKAVVFSISMMRGGLTPNIANARAARYYGVSTADVAFYVGQHAGRIRASKDGYSRGVREGAPPPPRVHKETIVYSQAPEASQASAPAASGSETKKKMSAREKFMRRWNGEG